MDVKEDKKEQEYSGNENSLMRKGKQTLKDKVKKIIIKKAIALLMSKLLLPMIIVASIFGGSVFFAGAEYLTDDDTEESTNNAKTQSTATTYSPNASVTQTDENGNTINKVIVTANASGNGYEIKYNNDAEYIKALRKKLEANSIVESVAGFTDLEIAVIGSLYESGAHLEAYTDEALKCLATFIKAEAGTSNLDLRPNSEKYDSSGNYVPKKIEDLAENEVPGVINLIRTNTNGGITKLEYKTENDFNGMKDANDPNVLNYFTINSNGELVYAKWKQIKVSKISGEYPENLPESEKLIEEDTYIYELDKIPYTEIVKGYTIPFEFLNQLLIITKEPDFCMELVDYALNSKIEINILEEQTITDEIETIDYIIYNKEEKYINYTLADTTKTDYLLIGKIDDYGKECTTYSYTDTYNYEDSAKVKIKRVRTEHTYKYEISEADTMFIKIINKFDYSAVAGSIQPEQLPPEDPLRTNNQYQQGEIIVYTDSDKISEDENVKTFKEENDISSVDTLIIKPYSKINTDSYIEKSVIKYSAKTQTPTTYYYAKDANGNYEKFLVAYNNSKGAQNNINSIDSWLYEMVEENEATVKLEKYLKYVLSVYDGKDRGVTEGELPSGNEYISIGTASGKNSEIILEKCVEVMNELLLYDVSYYSNLDQLVWKDIEKSGDFTNSNRAVCCSTYVALVLYRAGIFTEDFMNQYNYNSPEGLDKMFKEAGWIMVSEEEAQPGDVCNFTRDKDFRHSFIYAGENKIWDETSGAKKSDGTPPARGTKELWNYYTSNADVRVYRMP